MATWEDLTGYIGNHYKVADQQDGLVKLIFEFDDLRSQVVIVSKATLAGGAEEWLLIQSPFAKVGAVDPNSVLEFMSDMVCGGLARIGDLLTVRHAVPLANLNINEFERPLHLVTFTADMLEKKFAGRDAF